MEVKDKELILESILKMCSIMILISVALKLFGLNVFGFDIENVIIFNFCNFLEKYNLNDIIAFIFMFFDCYIILRLSCKNKNLKLYIVAALCSVTTNIITQIILFSQIGYSYYTLFSFSLAIIFSIIIDKKLSSKPLIVLFLIIIYQFLSLFLRNITFNVDYEIVYDFLLNFDYMILLIITYYLYLMKGSDIKWTYLQNYSHQQESDGVSLFSDLKITWKNLQKKLQIFSAGSKREKIFVVVYLILFTLHELLNLSVIIFVSFLNNSVIECLFILTSFLITKSVFGKPFHFSSASKCFVVSNITYFILNRITLSVGVSFVIPVALGVALAYITCLIVRKTEKIEEPKVTRGINEEILRKICENHNLNELETNILVDFYSKRMTIVKISMKYSYSQDGIWKKKKAAMKKIEGV